MSVLTTSSRLRDLRCTHCGRSHSALVPQTLSTCCQAPLLCRYDLDPNRPVKSRPAHPSAFALAVRRISAGVRPKKPGEPRRRLDAPAARRPIGYSVRHPATDAQRRRAESDGFVQSTGAERSHLEGERKRRTGLHRPHGGECGRGNGGLLRPRGSGVGRGHAPPHARRLQRRVPGLRCPAGTDRRVN